MTIKMPDKKSTKVVYVTYSRIKRRCSTATRTRVTAVSSCTWGTTARTRSTSDSARSRSSSTKVRWAGEQWPDSDWWNVSLERSFRKFFQFFSTANPFMIYQRSYYRTFQRTNFIHLNRAPEAFFLLLLSDSHRSRVNNGERGRELEEAEKALRKPINCLAALPLLRTMMAFTKFPPSFLVSRLDSWEREIT